MSQEQDRTDSFSTPRTRYESENIIWLGMLLVAGIFTTTLPQPGALGRLPLTIILKDQLHLSRTEVSGFFFLCGLFWYLKPLAGILTDAVPLFGTRRRNYLLVSSILAGISWIVMMYLPHRYNVLLLGAIVVNLFMVMASTVVGAFLVEIGQSRGATGRLTAVRQIAFNACGIIQGPVAGLLATGSLMLLAGFNAAGILLLFPFAYFILKEKRLAKTDMNVVHNASAQLKTMGQNRTFWLAIVFVALFYFAPSVGTIQNFRQLDVMKLSTVQIGLLQSAGSATAVLAAFCYGFVVRYVPLRSLLLVGVIGTVSSELLYVFYNTYALAFAIDSFNGLMFGFCEVALIDLAARATPAGCEGLGYSCLLSMRNFSLFLADLIASKLADTYHLSWSFMVCLNGGTTAVVLILLPFMPKLLMGSRDGANPNTENTGEPAAA